MSDRIVVNTLIAIDRGELRLSFSRSPGPGGQNVNKLNTKATLHWPIWESQSIDWEVKGRLARLAEKRINDRGELVLTSSRFRSQGQNIDDCFDKLRKLVLAAAEPPRARKATRPPKSAAHKRVASKRANSQKKSLRKPPSLDGDN